MADVVLSLACKYEAHASWEAHLLVMAQTKAQYHSNRSLPGQRLSGLPPPALPQSPPPLVISPVRLHDLLLQLSSACAVADHLVDDVAALCYYC